VPTIVSWNLCERPPGSPRKWNYVREGLKADLLLAQEAVVPATMRSAHRAGGIAGRDGKARRWGSAVVAVTEATKITPVGLAEGTWRGTRLGVAPLDGVGRGHVAIAKVELDGYRFTAISAYGLTEFGYASGTLLRTIADLEPVFDDPDLNQNILLAGDWNIGTWWSGEDHKYAIREGAALTLLEAYGLVDCLDRFRRPGRLDHCPCELGADCRHIHTFRKAGSQNAHMDD